MTMGISEILEKASKMKKKDEKINFLRENDSVALRTIVAFALHPNVKIQLPEGPVPYRPADLADENYGMLYGQVNKLYLYCEGGDERISQKKRELLFVQMMESIHPKDAELMAAAKDKKLPYKGLTKDVIEKAFPGLLDG